MANKSNNESGSKTQTVRGPALRKQIEESQEMGEQYRAQNHGADTLDTNVLHSDNTSRNRSMRTHSSKK